ncbi:Anaphase-promoting complex subunit 4 [Podila epicladia]|nr:Anaphase-promoting complex subunit 4 [Podila epicladia]
MYRLSWEKHWSIRVKAPPKQTGGASRLSAAGNADVVSLAWRPDGKMIAVGLDSGHINIYDYMDGSLAHTIAPVALENNPMSSIQCLKWTEVYLGPSPPTAFFGIRQSPKTPLDAMPLLSPIPESSTQQEMSARMMFAKHRRGAAARGGFGGAARTVAGTALGLSKAEDVTVLDEESSPIMNALFSSDNHGRFRLRLFGGFDMESISLKDMLLKFAPHQFQTIDILAADIQADLSELAIIALESTSEAKSTGRLLQITVGSGLLRGHAREIRALGVRARPVQHLLNYMDECLEVMKKDYGKLSLLAENSVESLTECLNNNGESREPTTEFSQLLLTGRPSVSMDQYLQHELGHHGVKRWDKSGKAAYENMRKVAFECLLPACERLVVHMTDILAYSRWRERYGPLDLDESKVYSCIRLAGEFIGMIERLFQALKVEIKQFHEFENWLEQAVEKLQPIARGADEQDEGPKRFPPVDTLSVAGYLKSGMGKGLANFFKESDATLEERVDQSVSRDVPSYPIVYPFAQELRELTIFPERDRPRVPFGLGLMGTSEPSTKRVPTMTIEGHLKQLIHYCHLVFEGPSLTLARSFKVLHLLNLTPLDPAPLSSNIQAQGDFKVSLRYCYQDLEPWLYVALYAPSSRANKEPCLCLLRSRKSEQPSAETPHSSEQDRILPNLPETGSGRKRKSSDDYVDSRKEPRRGTSLLSPGTVSKELSTLSLVSTPRMGLNTTDATQLEMAIDRYTEAVLFSLKVDGLPSLEGHEIEGYHEPAKWVNVRDTVFRDHDSLALLLNSPDTDQHGYMDQQYLVLMPLEPHKYTPDVLSDPGASLLDRLTVTNPSSATLALPIIMSRNVTQLSVMDTSFASTSLISNGIPDGILDKTSTLVGPCRIACNERGKSQVLSIHGPLQPGAQGAGRITIFDL